MSRCKACRTPFLTESCSRRRTFASPTRSSSGLTCASPSCCVTCHACVYIHAHLPLYMHTRLIRTCDRTDSFDLTCVLRSCFVTWFICTCEMTYVHVCHVQLHVWLIRLVWLLRCEVAAYVCDVNSCMCVLWPVTLQCLTWLTILFIFVCDSFMFVLGLSIWSINCCDACVYIHAH